MMSKRGLSSVVVTLILLLLSIISIGIIWYIFNSINIGSVQVDLITSEVDVDAKSFQVKENIDPDFYNISFSATKKFAGGRLSSLDLVISNGTDNYVKNVPVQIPDYGKVTIEVSVPQSELNSLSLQTITVIPVFLGEDGTESYGAISKKYDFIEKTVSRVSTISRRPVSSDRDPSGTSRNVTCNNLSPEICGDGKDNNCNAQIDENCDVSNLPPVDYLSEKLFDNHLSIPPLSSSVPQKCVPFTDPVTGVKVTRITDVNDDPVARNTFVYNMNGVKTSVSTVGIPSVGFNNGYSKYSDVNVNGKYLIAWPYGILYRISDCTYIGQIYSDAAKTRPLDPEGSETRWSRVPGEENVIYYHGNPSDGTNAKFMYKQDIVTGSVQTYYDLSKDPALISWINQGYKVQSGAELAEGDWSDNMRYWAGALYIGRDYVVYVYDRVQNKTLPGVIHQAPNPNGITYINAVDVSPDGNWLAVLTHTGTNWGDTNRLYKISDLANGDISKPVPVPSAHPNNFFSIGHNGWALDTNGDNALIYQDNRDDYWRSFNPKTNTTTVIFYYTDLGGWGWGMHLGRLSVPSKSGWIFMPTNGDPTDWATDQIMMVQFKDRTSNPNIWRIARSNNVLTQTRTSWISSKALVGGSSYDGDYLIGTNVSIGQSVTPSCAGCYIINQVYKNANEQNYLGTLMNSPATVLDVVKNPKGQVIWVKAKWYVDYAYFAEGSASLDYSGNNIYVGSNWNGTSELEVYKIELPTDWQDHFLGPEVTITSPSNPSTPLFGGVNIDASVVSTNPVSKVEFYVDNNKVGTDSSSPYSYLLNTVTISDGTHTLEVKAFDNLNHESSKIIQINVNNLAYLGLTKVKFQYGQPVSQLSIGSYSGMKDTLTSASAPNSGYAERGKTTSFDYRFSDNLGLYYFDISSIPSNAKITDAHLILYSNASGGIPGNVPIYLVKTLPPNANVNWVEGSGKGYYDQYGGTSWLAKSSSPGTVGDYNGRPTAVWSSNAGRTAPGDLSSAYLGSNVGNMVFVDAAGEQKSTNISSAVQYIISNNYKYEGFAVDMAGKEDIVRKDLVETREYNDPSMRPALEITYS